MAHNAGATPTEGLAMGMRRGLVVIVVLAAVGCSVPQVAAQPELMQRQRADKLHNDGNYAED